jgi:hypothetical protein
MKRSSEKQIDANFRMDYANYKTDYTDLKYELRIMRIERKDYAD